MDNLEKKARFERKVFVIITFSLGLFSLIYYVFVQFIEREVSRTIGESLAGSAQDLGSYIKLGGAILNFLSKLSTQ